jgi:hypothetical protein
MNSVKVGEKTYEGKEITIDGGVVKVDGRIVHIFAAVAVTVFGDVWGEIRAGTAVTIVGSALGGIKAGTRVTVGGRDEIVAEAQDTVREALAGRL